LSHLGGAVSLDFKAFRLFVSLNSRLASNKEEDKDLGGGVSLDFQTGPSLPRPLFSKVCWHPAFRVWGLGGYRGTSLIGNTPLLEPYSRTLPRVTVGLYLGSCGGPRGGVLFIMSEVPL